jgi:hypothetical protein
MVRAAGDAHGGQGFDSGLHMLVQAIDFQAPALSLPFLTPTLRGHPGALVEHRNTFSGERFARG